MRKTRCSSPRSFMIFFSLKRKNRDFREKFVFSTSITKIFFYPWILIRMFWNRNMMLTGWLRRPESLLMTFWKIFKIVMIFLQNFEKKSSRPRKFFKKLSKVTQMCFSTSLTTYFGFRAFWRVFLILRSFPWILKNQKKIL